MIPLHLKISGFLSYYQSTELNFSAFDLACISGANGAGKSSLLDAITWALFGRARRRDDALINTRSTVAEVVFIFAYEGNIYRVQRALPKGKTSSLEFHLCQADLQDIALEEITAPTIPWKPLNERTLRETQERIERTLRLDYDTFINASFFLQGKADLFTQLQPSQRKQILASILGLEIWETYRQRAAERRKAVERDSDLLNGQIAAINDELAEEEERKARLAEVEKQLEVLSQARQAQEEVLENYRRTLAILQEQREMVNGLRRRLEEDQEHLEGQRKLLSARRQEHHQTVQILAEEAQIRAAYQRWQQARADVEYWETLAEKFREQQQRRQPPLDVINAERARLMEEKRTLEEKLARVLDRRSNLDDIQAQITASQEALRRAEEHLAQRPQLEEALEQARQRQAQIAAENPLLKKEMDSLKARIDRLQENPDEAVCPTCGQPLSPAERQALIASLEAQGREMAERYRANKALLSEVEGQTRQFERQIADLKVTEAEHKNLGEKIARLQTQAEAIQQDLNQWEAHEAPRLAQVNQALQDESFAPEARQLLAQIDAELKAIGYDPQAHEAARQAEREGRDSEEHLRALEKARAALTPLEQHIANLEAQISAMEEKVAQRRAEFEARAAALAAAEAQAPNLYAEERKLALLREQENQKRIELGQWKQKVEVLDQLRQKRQTLEAQRQELARRIAQYKQIERACSMEGVPALLIDHAIPQIEARANLILDRLSRGNMSVRFRTQQPYKDPRREDLKETLDIQICDSAGVRPYEMFSGGEAFRINFAIRLALSEVLAQRAGARLQTLVIDEGFGSQDAEGRQRLVEVINLVRQDFAKILVITHLDELKDQFPTRIEVEKTNDGSRIQVIGVLTF